MSVDVNFRRTWEAEETDTPDTTREYGYQQETEQHFETQRTSQIMVIAIAVVAVIVVGLILLMLLVMSRKVAELERNQIPPKCVVVKEDDMDFILKSVAAINSRIEQAQKFANAKQAPPYGTPLTHSFYAERGIRYYADGTSVPICFQQSW
jgi:altronate dehydratase